MKNIISFLAITLLLASCGSKPNDEESAGETANDTMVTLTPIQLKNAGIVTGKIEQKEITSILKLNGKIDVPPQNVVSISVPLGGYLKTTKLLPGMHVVKGEVIAVMEDQQYIQLQQDYLTAKTKISFLEKEYVRQKELNESQASSDKVFQQAESDWRTQRILLTSLAQKLQLAGININRVSETNISRSVNILSPINGYVSAVNVNIGKYVSPTDVLFELINPTDIHLALKVFEKDLDKLYIGQKLMAFTNSEPDKKHPCEILLIGKDLSADRNTEVHCHFEDYDKTLIPGTYMNAEVEVKNKQAMLLPEEAIVRFEGRQYVYKALVKNQFEMVAVTVGESEKGFSEIINPQANNLLTADIVTKGAYTLLMMMKNKSE
ncbi:efflux RND transporter periplasmic adaptor subunit [soil metagenome]